MDGLRVSPVADAPEGELHRLQNRLVHGPLSIGGRAFDNCACDIGIVSCGEATGKDVDDDRFPSPQGPIAPLVWIDSLLAAGHDSVGGQALVVEKVAADHPLDGLRG